MPSVRMTQDELKALLVSRFGPDPMNWAFKCPTCSHVSTGQDFRDALAAHPQERKDGSTVTASHLLGRECIGRALGVLSKNAPYTGPGCDWAAYGLFRGPWFVTYDDGTESPCFPVAEAPCPDHKPKQHRDGKPPWCRACGLTKDYTQPVSSIVHEHG